MPSETILLRAGGFRWSFTLQSITGSSGADVGPHNNGFDSIISPLDTLLAGSLVILIIPLILAVSAATSVLRARRTWRMVGLLNAIVDTIEWYHG